MVSPVPKELQVEVVEQLMSLVAKVHRVGDAPQFEVARIRRDLDRLATISAGLADVHAAGLASILGDLEEAERRLLNAAKLGLGVQAKISRVAIMANHGYFGAASQIVDDLVQSANITDSNAVTLAFSAGAYRALRKHWDNCQQNHWVISMQSIPLFEKSNGASAVLDVLNVSEDDLRSSMDSAGMLMRNKGLFWQNLHADVFFAIESPDEGDPVFSLDYRIDVSPEEAADMNEELSFILAGQGLYRPGFSIGFLGTRIE